VFDGIKLKETISQKELAKFETGLLPEV